MSRLVSAGVVVYDQADFYYPPGTIIRLTGIVPANLAATVFINNGVISWPLVDGSTVPDSSVSAGSIYFNAIPSATDFYSIRFFPHQVGYWKIVIKHGSYSIELIKEYDVVPTGAFKPAGTSGLNAAFVK